MRKLTTAALAALLLVTTFLAPAYGQSQEQKFYLIDEVAKKVDTTTSSTAVQRDLQWRAERKTSNATTPQGGGSTACNGHFLVAQPEIAGDTSDVDVNLVVGCLVPSGTTLTQQIQYNDNTGTGGTWKTIRDLQPGQIVRWATEGSRSGGQFFLTIEPTGTTAQQLSTTFDMPITFRAYEQITQNATRPQRTIVAEGLSGNSGLRARLGPADVTNRISLTPTGGATIDMNGIDVPEGVFYPLTIAQTTGENQTSLVLHPDCENGRCSLPTPPVVPPSITITKNSALGDQTWPAGAAGERIASYVISTTTPTMIPSVSILVGAKCLQNLRIVTSAGAQFGATQASTTWGQTYSFSGQVIIPGGNMFAFDAYADITTPCGGTFNPATTLVNVVAIDTNSTSNIPTQVVSGQALTVTNDTPTLTIYASPVSIPEHAVMGSTGNRLGDFYVMNPGVTEDGRLTSITIADSTPSKKAAFSNLQFFRDGTLVGTASAAQPTPESGYLYTFRFSVPILIKTGAAVPLMLKGDAASYASGGAEDNSVHAFGVVGAEAIGATTGRMANIGISNGFARPITVLRTDLSISTFGIGGPQHVSSTADTIGSITLSASSAGPLALNKLMISFAGSNAFLSSSTSVALIDMNGNNVVTIKAAGLGIESGHWTAAWWFGSSGCVIPAGQSMTLTLRVDSSVIPSGGTLSAFIANTADLTFTDGLDSSATSGLTLPAAATPIVINAVTYH